jgi:nicotinamidase-related amidase
MKFASLILITLACSAFCGETLTLKMRSRAKDPAKPDAFIAKEETKQWDAAKTAVVICDMWDHHWCKSAEARVGEMAPRVNAFVNEARKRGALIIHCPSDTMKFYADTPQRKLAQAAPKVETTVPLQRWVKLIPEKEGKLPIDDSDGGCDCDSVPPKGPPYPWTRQIDVIEVRDGDAITDSAEAYYLMKQRGIENVIELGVHTNMCVLGRPFSIRQLVTQGLNVVLVRDLTDAMYNPKMPPHVSHFEGTRLVIEHIEKHWCPTITSDALLGGGEFKFKDDK